MLSHVFEAVKNRIKVYFLPGLQISKHALGKYIIAFACLLHMAWAGLFIMDERAGNATPLAILVTLLNHDRVLTIAVLIFVALLAGGFLDLRLRKIVNITALSMMLIPQQLVLWCSAGAGIYASIVQHYADGVTRSWVHILVDQLPVILMALLYTVALIEVCKPPNTDHAVKSFRTGMI